VISSFDFGHLLDGPLLHRGDPFSHPSGSSAGTEKALPFFFFSFLYIKSFFVLVFSYLLPISAPIPLLRDQKTFSTGPRSFSL
jgi:hypothetical protein